MFQFRLSINKKAFLAICKLTLRMVRKRKIRRTFSSKLILERNYVSNLEIQGRSVMHERFSIHKKDGEKSFQGF
jgi:hypothetical protein